MKVHRILFILIINLMVFSCVTTGISQYQPHLQDFHKDNSFTSSKLDIHGITVIGLLGEYSEISMKDRDALNSHLFYYLKSKMDSDKVSYLLYNKEDQVKPDNIPDLNLDSDIEKRIIYVVDNYLAFSETINKYLVYYTLNDNRTGRSTYTADDYVYFVSTRTVDITMHVYDRENDLIVWEGRSSYSKYNKKSNSLGTEDKDQGLLEGLLDIVITSSIEGVIDLAYGQYHDYPTFLETGNIVLVGFVNNLLYPQEIPVPERPISEK